MTMAEPQVTSVFRCRFEFKKELGKGGMGEDLAQDAHTWRDGVTLKFLRGNA